MAVASEPAQSAGQESGLVESVPPVPSVPRAAGPERPGADDGGAIRSHGFRVIPFEEQLAALRK
ncbi:hypothetical protein [Streptomyces nodosus]|uniref:hypothetical protein n=1 Tax=Streptomyces nodosus TaxID=40318 RepID=UPI00380FCE2E